MNFAAHINRAVKSGELLYRDAYKLIDVIIKMIHKRVSSKFTGFVLIKKLVAFDYRHFIQIGVSVCFKSTAVGEALPLPISLVERPNLLFIRR